MIPNRGKTECMVFNFFSFRLYCVRLWYYNHSTKTITHYERWTVNDLAVIFNFGLYFQKRKEIQDKIGTFQIKLTPTTFNQKMKFKTEVVFLNLVSNTEK